MHFVVTCLICGLAVFANAQKNAAYVEALGNGGLVSLNYERQITSRPLLRARLGVGVTEDDLIEKSQLLSLASSFHYLVDLRRSNYLDFSIGVSWFDASEYGPSGGVTQIFTAVGFRRNFGKRWFFRGHISPYIKTLSKSKTIKKESMSGQYGGFGGFSFAPYAPRFYGYGHKDAWLGFSIGILF